MRVPRRSRTQNVRCVKESSRGSIKQDGMGIFKGDRVERKERLFIQYRFMAFGSNALQRASNYLWGQYLDTFSSTSHQSPVFSPCRSETTRVKSCSSPGNADGWQQGVSTARSNKCRTEKEVVCYSAWPLGRRWGSYPQLVSNELPWRRVDLSAKIYFITFSSNVLFETQKQKCMSHAV